MGKVKVVNLMKHRRDLVLQVVLMQIFEGSDSSIAVVGKEEEVEEKVFQRSCRPFKLKDHLIDM